MDIMSAAVDSRGVSLCSTTLWSARVKSGISSLHRQSRTSHIIVPLANILALFSLGQRDKKGFYSSSDEYYIIFCSKVQSCFSVVTKEKPPMEEMEPGATESHNASIFLSHFFAKWVYRQKPDFKVS